MNELNAANPDFTQAETACEKSAFAARDCGKSFGAVLTHFAQGSPSARRKVTPEQAPVSGRVEARLPRAKPKGRAHISRRNMRAKRPEPGLVVSYWKNPPGAKAEATLPHWVLGLTLDGIAEQGQPNGKRFLMGKGDLGVIRANTPQRWRARGKTDWHSIGCIFDPRPHWISWMNWEEIAPGYMKLTLHDLKVRREIRNGLFRAYRLGKSGLPDATDFVYNAIENVILSANRYYQLSSHSKYDPRIGNAIQYLAENLSSPLSLNEVATHSNLSRAHLACLFKKQVGIGPIAFQNQQRITRAGQMLRMSFLSIKQIAIELGFKNPKYFSACFRKVTGVNPRQYRRERTSV